MGSIGTDYTSGSQQAKDEAAQKADEKRQRSARKAIEEARESEQETKQRAIDMSRDYDVQIGRMNRKNEEWLSHALQSKDQKVKEQLERNSERERSSRATEASQLRDQVREASTYRNEAKKEYNRARTQAINDVEQQYGGEKEQIVATNAAEMAKLKNSHKEMERYLGRSYDESIRDQATKMSNLIGKQNAEHTEQSKFSADEYNRSLASVQGHAKKSQELSEQRLEKQAEEFSFQREEALKKQGSIYQKAISNQRQDQQSQIKTLERRLNENNTTDDPGQISAAAEAAVRKQMETKYEKTLNAEIKRNKGDRDQLAQAFETRFRDSQNNTGEQTGQLIRDQNLERHQMRNTFVSHVQDVEDSKRHLLNLADEKNLKSQDKMVRNNERTSTEIRRHYEDLINERESQSQIDRMQMVQQYEFEKKNMNREHSIKTTDLIRNYEKQMADQRQTYEDQLHELKSTLDRTQRESDKRVNHTVGELTRAHNRRITELEAQNKQRERTTALNHEDQLEKVKRAHALMSSQKG